MKLIPQWRRAWRYASVQVALVLVAYGFLERATQIAILEMLHISPAVAPAVAGLAFIVARIIQWKAVDDSPGDGPLR